MKAFILLLGIITTCLGDSCDNHFGAFLNALKNEINQNQAKSKALELEFRDDFRRLVRRCFSQTTGDAGRCALSDSELTTDQCGDSGPLRGCSKCQGMCSSLRDKILRAPEQQKKCFRQKFAQAVREEIEPCIQGKINDYNFHVPEIPDFDQNAQASLNVIEDALSERTMAYSRLDVCRTVNPDKYKNTASCVAKGYPGIYSKHCQCAKNAKAKSVSSSCSARFAKLKSATVSCLLEKRNLWHQKFAQVYKIVQSATSASQCASDISNSLGSWVGKLQDALNDCIPNDQQHQKQRNLRTLIELGCGQVVNGGVKKNELTIGFRSLRLFLDALNDRILVYVDRNCSY